MPTVSELLSKNITNATTNSQTWGGILFNVKAYGATGDGATDDSTDIQDCIDACVLAGANIVYFPPGEYLATGLTDIAEVVFMGNGATMSGYSVYQWGSEIADYALDTASTDDYTISLAGIEEYKAGLTVKFKAVTANTGACTLNVNSLGAKSITKSYNSDLSNSDIVVNQVVVVVYDGTRFQLASPLPVAATDLSDMETGIIYGVVW